MPPITKSCGFLERIAVFTLCGALLGACGCRNGSVNQRQESLPAIAVPAVMPLEKPLASPAEISKVRDSRIVSQFEYLPARTTFQIWSGSEATTGGSLNYYLPPMLVFEMNVLRAALADAIKKGPVIGLSNATPRYRMSFAAELSNPKLRQAAADHLNAKYRDIKPAIKYNPEMLSILPYSWLEAEAVFDGGSRRLTLLARDDQAGLVVTPQNTVTLVAIGTEEELRELVEQAQIQITAYVAGFSVKQNIVSGSIAAFAQQGFAHDLEGDAIWKDFKGYQNGSGGFSASLGPISLGAKGGGGSTKQTRESLVTRNQVLAMSQRCASKIVVNEWYELSDPDREAKGRQLAGQVATLLLAKFQEVWVELDAQGKIIRDERINEDLKADQIDSLDSAIKQKWDSKRDSNQSATMTTAGGPVTGSNSDKLDLLLDDDVTWKGSGKAIVPKAVRLHQVNQAALDRLAEFRFVTTVANEGSTLARTKGVFVQAKAAQLKVAESSAVPFEIPKMSHVSGGDPDVNSKSDRTTALRMWHADPVETPTEIRVVVTCEVYEKASNHTKLRGSVTVTVPKPAGYARLNLERPYYHPYSKPVKEGAGRAEKTIYSLSQTVGGKLHHWVNIATDPKSIVQNLKITPDGSGDDHTGNAKAKGTIWVPYWSFEGDKPMTTEYSVR